jgi:diaminopimelate epimerase
MIIDKYEAAGNDFLIITSMEKYITLSKESIVRLCDRRKGIGADGVIIMEKSSTCDFKMRFYNNDGSGGMFCGNGGRAIVDMANRLNLPFKEENGNRYKFEAPDGIHFGSVWNTKERMSNVRISLNDVKDIQTIDILENEDIESTGYIIDTGCPHLVLFTTKELSSLDVYNLGRKWRYDQRFAPNGINVDFVSIETPEKIRIRTYERGVEYETPSCGTGVVASAIATHLKLKNGNCQRNYFIETSSDNFITYLRADENNFDNIELTGPTNYVFRVELPEHQIF